MSDFPTGIGAAAIFAADFEVLGSKITGAYPE